MKVQLNFRKFIFSLLISAPLAVSLVSPTCGGLGKVDGQFYKDYFAAPPCGGNWFIKELFFGPPCGGLGGGN